MHIAVTSNYIVVAYIIMAKKLRAVEEIAQKYFKNLNQEYRNFLTSCLATVLSVDCDP